MNSDKLPEGLMEKRNVVEARRTPEKDFKKQDNWDKRAADLFSQLGRVDKTISDRVRT